LNGDLLGRWIYVIALPRPPRHLRERHPLLKRSPKTWHLIHGQWTATLSRRVMKNLLREPASLQVFCYIAAALVLDDRGCANRTFNATQAEIAEATCLSLRTVERHLEWMTRPHGGGGGKSVGPLLICKKRSVYQIAPELLGFSRPSKAMQARQRMEMSRYGRPEYGKFTAWLAYRMIEVLVGEVEYPGGLQTVAWFMSQTVLTGKLNRPNAIPTSMSTVAGEIHRGRHHMKKTWDYLARAGILAKRTDGWSLASDMFQCGSKTFA